MTEGVDKRVLRMDARDNVAIALTPLRRGESIATGEAVVSLVSDIPAKHKYLSQTRTRGYAIDDEENEDGVRCVGAAVLDYAGRPVAGISVSGPAFSITRERLPEVSRPLLAAAQALSAELGYRATATETARR